jgi:nucleotide-binding universal stress UspA family protein
VSPVEVVHISASVGIVDRLRGMFVRDPVRQSLEDHLDNIKTRADGATLPNIRKLVSSTVSNAIVEEAQKGYDVILMGASERRSHVIEDVVESAPCHVVIMRSVADPPTIFRRLLVPIEGGVASRTAVEFALRYAEATEASLTLALLTEHRQQAGSYAADPGDSLPVSVPRPSIPDPEAELERISRVFRASDLRPEILRLRYDPTNSAINEEVATGKYDLVVIGAENRAIQHRLFFGYEKERLIRKSPVSVAIVVPNISKLS